MSYRTPNVLNRLLAQKDEKGLAVRRLETEVDNEDFEADMLDGGLDVQRDWIEEQKSMLNIAVQKREQEKVALVAAYQKKYKELNASMAEETNLKAQQEYGTALQRLMARHKKEKDEVDAEIKFAIDDRAAKIASWEQEFVARIEEFQAQQAIVKTKRTELLAARADLQRMENKVARYVAATTSSSPSVQVAAGHSASSGAGATSISRASRSPTTKQVTSELSSPRRVLKFNDRATGTSNLTNTAPVLESRDDEEVVLPAAPPVESASALVPVPSAPSAVHKSSVLGILAHRKNSGHTVSLEGCQNMAEVHKMLVGRIITSDDMDDFGRGDSQKYVLRLLDAGNFATSQAAVTMWRDAPPEFHGRYGKVPTVWTYGRTYYKNLKNTSAPPELPSDFRITAKDMLGISAVSGVVFEDEDFS